jgi:hypothetical protein
MKNDEIYSFISIAKYVFLLNPLTVSKIYVFQISNWKILDRINPAQNFPSDFDIISFESIDLDASISALESHPAIKRVTSQRIVHRMLHYTEDTENDGRFSNDTEIHDDFLELDDDCDRSTCIFKGWRTFHFGRMIRSHRMKSKVITIYRVVAKVVSEQNLAWGVSICQPLLILKQR